jgi:hypothetical protein
MYEALEGGSLPVVEPDEYHARLLGSDFSLPTLAFPEGMDAKLCPPLEVSKERADRVRRGEGAVGSEEGRYTAGGACDVWSRLSDLISSFGNERYEERRAKVLQWWRGHKQAVGMNVGRLVQYGSAWGKDSSAWSDGGQPAAVGATGAASVVTEGECAHYDLACWAEVNRGKDADDSVLHEAIQEARTKVESLFEVWDTGAGDEEPHSHSTWEWDGQGNPPPVEELDVGTYPQPGCRNDCDCAGADSCGKNGICQRFTVADPVLLTQEGRPAGRCDAYGPQFGALGYISEILVVNMNSTVKDALRWAKVIMAKFSVAYLSVERWPARVPH